MKKVLCILNNIRISNGVTSAVMNPYDSLIAAGYRVDFCALLNWGSFHVARIRENGGQYVVLPQRGDVPNEARLDDEVRDGEPDEQKAEAFLRKLMRENRYDIVHIHIVGKYALLAARAAKRCGVPCRVFHCHNPRDARGWKGELLRLRYDVPAMGMCTHFAACSQSAGESFFGSRPFQVIRNTMDLDAVHFTAEGRSAVRQEYGIGAATVLFGTVCRQARQKNPFFIVDVFVQLRQRVPDCRFLWVGSGPQEEAVRDYAAQKGVADAMIFAGNRSDVGRFYSAMDVFLLPSLFEGLGIVFLEAQACGAVTYASDAVPRDTGVTELIHYLPLSQPAEAWADTICGNPLRADNREQYRAQLAASGFSKETNKDLVNFYDSIG